MTPQGPGPGADLDALIARLALPVQAVSCVSPLVSAAWGRAAFRITLADGTIVKGRQFESMAAADRFAALAPLTPVGPFPRLRARLGLATLTDWMDGVPMTAVDMPATRGHELGSLLRRLHGVVIGEAWPGHLTHYPGSSWRQELAARLNRLEQGDALSRVESRRLLEMSIVRVPPRTGTVLVHGDLAPENVVVGRDGALHVIDIDSLDVHAPQFDLARTRYRWPMTVEQWAAFAEGYGSHEIMTCYERQRRFWDILVLVSAADFRLRHHLPEASTPIRQLRELILNDDLETTR